MMINDLRWNLLIWAAFETTQYAGNIEMAIHTAVEHDLRPAFRLSCGSCLRHISKYMHARTDKVGLYN